MESIFLNPIYNVMAITLTIFTGIAIYLYRLNRKLTLLEKDVETRLPKHS